jgi:hypothetical protein
MVKTTADKVGILVSSCHIILTKALKMDHVYYNKNGDAGQYDKYMKISSELINTTDNDMDFL